MAVEQPGARVVGHKVQASRCAAQSADAVGVAALVPHHVAVPVDAVQIQRIALQAASPFQASSECLDFPPQFLGDQLTAHVETAATAVDFA